MLAHPCPFAAARASALLLISMLLPTGCTSYGLNDSNDPEQEMALAGISRWQVAPPEAWGHGSGPSDDVMTDAGELPRFRLPDGSLMPLRLRAGDTFFLMRMNACGKSMCAT